MPIELHKTSPKVGFGKGTDINPSLFLDTKTPVSINLKGHLPHWEQIGKLQYITLHLADSLPTTRLKEFEELKQKGTPTFFELELIDAWLAKGHGKCLLQYQELLEIVEEALNYYDGKDYALYDYVIMPNHIHFIVVSETEIRNIISQFQHYTTRRINEIINGKGRIWHKEYFDHILRDIADYNTTAEYIKGNPLALKKQ